MTIDTDDFVIELDCPCGVWDALKQIAKQSLTQSCMAMIEAGATRQELYANLNDVLIPQMHKWMRDQYAFITEAMQDDVQSIAKH